MGEEAHYNADRSWTGHGAVRFGIHENIPAIEGKVSPYRASDGGWATINTSPPNRR